MMAFGGAASFLLLVLLVACTFQCQLCQRTTPTRTALNAVRLSNASASPEQGPLQVQETSVSSWQYLCAANVDDKVARVVCRQLGLPLLSARTFSSAPFGTLRTQTYSSTQVGISKDSGFLHRRYRCDGSESALAQCLYVRKTCAFSDGVATVACPLIDEVNKWVHETRERTVVLERKQAALLRLVGHIVSAVGDGGGGQVERKPDESDAQWIERLVMRNFTRARNESDSWREELSRQLSDASAQSNTTADRLLTIINLLKKDGNERTENWQKLFKSIFDFRTNNFNSSTVHESALMANNNNTENNKQSGFARLSDLLEQQLQAQLAAASRQRWLIVFGVLLTALLALLAGDRAYQEYKSHAARQKGHWPMLSYSAGAASTTTLQSAAETGGDDSARIVVNASEKC